jgi:hypothetical protein
MAEPGRTQRVGIGLAVGLLAILVGWRMCSKSEPEKEKQSELEPKSTTAGSKNVPAASSADTGPGRERAGLSAPLAAAHVANGEVIVAALDVSAKAIRVQRLGAKDEVIADRIVLGDVTWSTDSDLKVSAHPKEGAAVTWRGLRGGKLVRQLVILGPDLAPRGEPADVAAASCATRDAVWLSDGSHAISRPWSGAVQRLDLPKGDDVSLLCGPNRAFAVLEGEERTSLHPLTPRSGDAGSIETKQEPALTVMRESDFGEDEQRELSEYTVGDDVGVVRLGGSGAVAVREIVGGALGPLRKLKTLIPRDDDVVAVDASPKVLSIVYTQDASSACPQGSSGSTVVSTKVTALRIDRVTFDESTVELSPGRCAHEVGPFHTGVIGDGVSVAWTERTGGAGRARAPIAGIAHTLVTPSGSPALARIDEPADALVDAGCDGSLCYAAALLRREGTDGMVPGFVKIIRYK